MNEIFFNLHALLGLPDRATAALHERTGQFGYRVDNYRSYNII